MLGPVEAAVLETRRKHRSWGPRAGVESLPGELLAEPDDLLLDLRRNRVRAGVRASGARLEGRLAPTDDRTFEIRPRSGGRDLVWVTGRECWY